MSGTRGIGIIGGGVVGEGVYQLLTERRESLTRACVAIYISPDRLKADSAWT